MMSQEKIATVPDTAFTGPEDEAISGLSADGWRMRAGVEASRRVALDGGRSVEPFAEAAARRGDGPAGSGLEVAGGVRFNADRLQVEARGRWLAAHTEDGVKERGLSVTARFSPDPRGMGLSFALTPRWGAGAGEARALWGEELPGTSEGSHPASVNAALGYSFILAGAVVPRSPAPDSSAARHTP